MKVIAWIIGVPLALAAVLLLAIGLTCLIAALGAPVAALTWNWGVVPLAAALGAKVATIGLAEGFGLCLVGMTLRGIFSSRGNVGQEFAESIEKNAEKKTTNVSVFNSRA